MKRSAQELKLKRKLRKEANLDVVFSGAVCRDPLKLIGSSPHELLLDARRNTLDRRSSRWTPLQVGACRCQLFRPRQFRLCESS